MSRPPLGERLAVGADEAARLLSLSRDSFDRHVAAELRSVRVGRRRLYPVAELRAWLEREAARHPLDPAERQGGRP